MAAAAISSLLLFYPRQKEDRQVPSLLSRPVRFDAARDRAGLERHRFPG